jgi:hypothetical protein
VLGAMAETMKIPPDLAERIASVLVLKYAT